jgi:hypothetical protein
VTIELNYNYERHISCLKRLARYWKRQRWYLLFSGFGLLAVSAYMFICLFQIYPMIFTDAHTETIDSFTLNITSHGIVHLNVTLLLCMFYFGIGIIFIIYPLTNWNKHHLYNLLLILAARGEEGKNRSSK